MCRFDPNALLLARLTRAPASVILPVGRARARSITVFFGAPAPLPWEPKKETINRRRRMSNLELAIAEIAQDNLGRDTFKEVAA